MVKIALKTRKTWYFWFVAVVCVLAVGYGGCRLLEDWLFGPERRECQAEVASPEGHLVAHLYEDIGATLSSSVFEVCISPSAEGETCGEVSDWVWRATRIEPERIEWLDEKTLRVIIDRSYKDDFPTMRTRKRHGVSVITEIR